MIDLVMTAMAWVKAGCPKRPPDVIREIYLTQCRPCSEYVKGRNIFGQRGYCKKCGCHVSASSTNPLNKILDPMSRCPLDPPKWRSMVE